MVNRDAIGGACCPVAALAWRIANLQGMQSTTPLSTVCLPHRGISWIINGDNTIVVQWGATFNQKLSQGYTLDWVLSHSLRAGGAMAMKLSGTTNNMIMQIGCWTSLTYLTYIHSQIDALSAGAAWKLATAFTF